ncbi:MAG: hypothetical protein ACP5SI_02405 [Chloroflexia bacterium]
MGARAPIHRYPKWFAWPLEVVALLLVVPTAWQWLHVHLQVLFRQWPGTLTALAPWPFVQRLSLVLSGPVPSAPAAWPDLYPQLLRANGWAFGLFLLAALIRSFHPAMRVMEEGLQVRRGLGWTTLPWGRITQVLSMTLPGEKLVVLVQGQRLPLGFWHRFYSLLWGAGLAKGVLFSWRISDLDSLAREIVAHLQEHYGETAIAAVVDDTAYSPFYALLFQPRETWRGLFAPHPTVEDAYTYPWWVTAVPRTVAALLLAAGTWRVLGVWWRFVAGRFSALARALGWPVIGSFLRTFGEVPTLSPQDPAAMRQAAWGLLAGQVAMVLLLIGVVFLWNLFPNWLLGAEGLSVRYRRRWLRISWDKVRALHETPFSRGGGVALLQTQPGCLTAWHFLYSLFYGAGLRRGVLFSSLLPGYAYLAQRIRTGGFLKRDVGRLSSIPEEASASGERSDMLQMACEPRAAVRAMAEELLSGGALLKKPGLLEAWVPSEFSWGTQEEEGQEAAAGGEKEEPKGEPHRFGRPARAAGTMGAFAFLLVLAEEWLFPALARPLALFAFRPVSLPESWWSPLLLAGILALLALVEWPFMAGMVSTVAEMYEQPGEFRNALALYPRTQTPRVLVAMALLLLGSTGLVQPLFLLWWALAGLWGGILLWLALKELYAWEGIGIPLAVVAFALYQGLLLLLYAIFH